MMIEMNTYRIRLQINKDRDFNMSMLKRSYSASQYYVAKRPKKAPQKMRIGRAPSSGITRVTRCATYSFDFTTDWAAGFGFSATRLWVNGSSTSDIPVISEITDLFDMVRVARVDVIVLPTANDHLISADSVTTGIRNIPYVYMAADYSDNGVPNINSLLQADKLLVTSFDHPIRKTIYPRLSSAASNGILLGNNNWVAAGSDFPCNGLKIYMDVRTNMPYVGGTVNFIIHYECKHTK